MGGISLPTLTAIWKTLTYKTLWSLFADGMQLSEGYTEPLEETVYFLPEVPGTH